MMNDSGLFDGVFGVIFISVCVIIACVFVFVIYSIGKGWRAAKKAGFDPITMKTQMAAKAMNSKLLAPHESVEVRLAKIDDLRTRGVISEAEHASARADIIRDA